MKNLIPTSVYCLLFAWLSISWTNPVKNLPLGNPGTDSTSAFPLNSIDLLYERMNLGEKGLSKKAFEYACLGYRRIQDKHLISEPGYLTICDFSQSSKYKRLYVVDMASEELIMNTYVAHGKNSGGEFATRFSNRPSSLQSSLGFFLTNNIYQGEHGLSLRVKGLEAGINDKAMARNIVVHGADYIEDGWLNRSHVMGRSYGCPAVPRQECASLINIIKNGSVLFIYHPTASYLKRSKILND